MKIDIWMPWYPGDYQRDTQHLTTLEHGAYRLLIDACWCRGGMLPNDDGDLARIVHLQPSEWLSIRSRIASFFIDSDGHWTHNRVTRELNNAKNNANAQQKRTESARRALQSKREAVTNTVTEHVTMSSSPSPSPSPTLSIELPHGFPKNEKEAETIAEFIGVDKSFAVSTWNLAAGRGGRDSRDVLIRDFGSHLKACKSFQQSREQEIANRNGREHPISQAGPPKEGDKRERPGARGMWEMFYKGAWVTDAKRMVQEAQ
jgi:uncharacterized protein YdaU (DUF1376 family)